MGAFVATLQFLERQPVIDHRWRYGERLIEVMNRAAAQAGVSASLKAGGIPCSPYYQTLDKQGQPSLELRTLFAQEMVRQGVLMPWIALSFRHGDEELALTERALREALPVYRRALEEGCAGLLEGAPIKPVFRRFN
jgi:glutamate-1-semialdehyde 2,1-aminomutase